MREADALEARRQQSQKALEAAQRQRELEFEHKRAAEAKARENAERLARDAAERLEAMRSQWRESSALQQVPPPHPPPSTTISAKGWAASAFGSAS